MIRRGISTSPQTIILYAIEETEIMAYYHKFRKP